MIYVKVRTNTHIYSSKNEVTIGNNGINFSCFKFNPMSKIVNTINTEWIKQ